MSARERRGQIEYTLMEGGVFLHDYPLPVVLYEMWPIL